ncbi:MAG: alpha/beta hydrolase [Bacteroidales bacterium]|nr:alpha/beta hydrolase [Bacteroidales bacterium]
MKRLTILLFIYTICFTLTIAQDFIPLWPSGQMPNSKGMALEEIIVNNRITQVDNPGIQCFFPANEEINGCAVLICPSGGYVKLTYDLGGIQLAKWFNTLGITAFVLKYRLPNSPDLQQREIAPMQDAQRAMRIIRAHASEWKLDTGRIGIMGASAGGHLASTLGTHFNDVSALKDTLDKYSFDPNLMILISPVISMGEYTHKGSRDNLLGENASEQLLKAYSNELHVSSKTPPAFIVHASNDNAVNPMNSVLFYEALLKNNVSASLHTFPQGKHAIGVAKNLGSTKLWMELCREWMIEMDLINNQ